MRSWTGCQIQDASTGDDECAHGGEVGAAADERRGAVERVQHPDAVVPVGVVDDGRVGRGGLLTDHRDTRCQRGERPRDELFGLMVRVGHPVTGSLLEDRRTVQGSKAGEDRALRSVAQRLAHRIREAGKVGERPAILRHVTP
jgi:hypothetical protein